MALSLVSYGDSGSDSEREDEAISGSTVGKRTQQDVRKLLSVLPPPRVKGGGPSKQKPPVRIGLPVLSKANDSDSDDDLPVAKKPNQGSGKGLTALLPAPKGAARQFGSGKKPAPSMSSMVPYTLTKRYQDTKKKTKSSKTSKPTGKHGDEDSDSDNDEPISFFSHIDESSPALKPSVPIPRGTVEPSDPVPVPTSQEQHIPESNGVSTPSDHHPSSTCGLSGFGQQDQLTSPTSYNKYNDQNNSTVTQYQGWAGSNEQFAYSYGSSLQGYPNQYPDTEHSSGQQLTTDTDTTATVVGPGLSINDEQLRRLAGKQRKGKKRDESLYNILEIREDDVKEGIRDYQKYHSEESVNKLYQSDAAKLKAPTGQQKRKHQLSYLAHQAKANELELSKHWAQSAATKRQTQMKYGF